MEWFGAPPAWKCVKCGKPESDFEHLDGLRAHVANCRGLWKSHSEGAQGEWSTHGTRVVKLLMGHKELASHAELIEAAGLTTDRIPSFTANKLRAWLTGKQQLQAMCDKIGEHLWRWAASSTVDLLGSSMVRRGLTPEDLHRDLSDKGGTLHKADPKQAASRRSPKLGAKGGEEKSSKVSPGRAPDDESLSLILSPPPSLEEVRAWLDTRGPQQGGFDEPRPETMSPDDDEQDAENGCGKDCLGSVSRSLQLHIHKAV